MRIAFLISAYTDPKQLRNLIIALQTLDAYFYIHVDKGIPIDDFKSETDNLQKVYFITKRVSVNWGGFSQVIYQKNLLETAIQSGIRFDRIFILSAQDYPIIPTHQIEQILIEQPRKQFINGYNMSKTTDKHLRSAIRLYHFRDFPIGTKSIQQYLARLCRIGMRILPIRKSSTIHIDGKQWDIYKSSSYMCITFDLACYIYDQMLHNRRLINSLRHAFIPEELVIPTIVFNSSFRDEATLFHDYPGLQGLSAITYFEYGQSIKVFTADDFQTLRDSGKMFARKFQSSISDSLIKLLNTDQ